MHAIVNALQARVLLNWPAPPQGHNEHDAVSDAIKSICFYNHYAQNLQNNPQALQQAQGALAATQAEPSFARRHPTFEGVCMGNRKTCSCGAVFMSS